MTTVSLEVPDLGPIELTVDDSGTGRPVLLLHGGAGPASVAGFSDLLAARLGVRVLVPTHPGFAGTPRPAALTTIGQLAGVYAALLDELDLTDVLVDAVGIDVPGHPVADFFALSFPELAQLSYADPNRFRIDPSALPPAAQAAMAGNRATLAVYAADGMTDPSLRARLAGIDVPTVVVWGEADRIVDVEVGRAYAAAIPGARFELLEQTGHLPQLESPERLLAVLAGVL